MKKYIDDNGNLAPSVLIIDGMQVFNPTSEQYEAAGYHIMPIPNENEDSTPDNPTDDKLNMAKKQKIKEILKYDSSVEVNSFIYNGKAQWFTAEQRSNFKVSIDAAVLLGEDSEEIREWCSNWSDKSKEELTSLNESEVEVNVIGLPGEELMAGLNQQTTFTDLLELDWIIM
jgi:hypothetical protein